MTGLITRQRWLPAGVCRFDSAKLWCRVEIIDSVDKYNPRIAVKPCLPAYKPENPSCAFIFYSFFSSRAYKFVILVFLYSIHKVTGYCNRDVKISQYIFLAFYCYKLLYIGMIDIQYAHICPP